ncbi:MAG: hypothetical protein ACOH19_02745 [Rhodoglobus sp.]
MPFRLELDPEIDVVISSPNHATRKYGIRGHRSTLGASDVVFDGSLRVTSPARTWCDLASVLSEEDLVAAGDFLLAWEHPLMTRSELNAAIATHPGRRWRARMLAAAAMLTDRSESRPESIFRVRFHHAGLPAPAVNLELFDSHGRFIARPDLTFVHYREVVEYEGDHHRTDPQQWAKDLKRVPLLEEHDWHTTRASKADLADSRELIARIRRLLRAKGWQD